MSEHRQEAREAVDELWQSLQFNKLANRWERACKIFLSGCSCSTATSQERCEECLKEFCNHLRHLARDEDWKGIGFYCLPEETTNEADRA